MEFTSTECLHKMNISGCVLSPFTRWILFDTLVNLLKVIKNTNKTQDLSSVQFSRSVVSDSLRPHGLQHARLPYPSPVPRACSKSCPLSQWCHPTISSSVVFFSSCLQSFPSSESFLMNQFFTSSGQSSGASTSDEVIKVIKNTKQDTRPILVPWFYDPGALPWPAYANALLHILE